MDIDKKIAEIESWISKLNFSDAEREGLVWLINQLKKYREKQEELDRTYPYLDAFQHGIEQRTKDDCIDAGWKWIAEKYSHRWIQVFPKRHFESFKQAIDSVGEK